MSGNRASTISKISEELKISRNNCVKILDSAKNNLKEILANKIEEDMDNNE